jgi:vacuolar-type H+-ATPase subunit C/Vma6
LNLPNKTWQEKKDDGTIVTVTETADRVYYEDIQQAFGGERPADVMRNVFNYAIEAKLNSLKSAQ